MAKRITQADIASAVTRMVQRAKSDSAANRDLAALERDEAVEKIMELYAQVMGERT